MGVVSSRVLREGFYSAQSGRVAEDSFGGSFPAFIADFTRSKPLSEGKNGRSSMGGRAENSYDLYTAAEPGSSTGGLVSLDAVRLAEGLLPCCRKAKEPRGNPITGLPLAQKRRRPRASSFHTCICRSISRCRRAMMRFSRRLM